MRSFSGALLFGVLILAGCSSSDGRVGVTGTVNFQGKPLESGTIQFHPTDLAGKSSFGGTEIVQGKYSLDAKQGLFPGKYKVMISSPDPKAKEAEAMPGETGPPAKDRIPKKYNSDSKEFVEIKASGENKFDFDLK